MTKTHLAIGFALAASAAGPVLASVTYYTNKAQWISACGGDTAEIDFHLTSYEPLGVQYAGFGVQFGAGAAYAVQDATFADGWGAKVASLDDPAIPIDYDTPQYGFAVDGITALKVRCYLGDSLVFESSNLYPNRPTDPFRGFLLDTPFDRVVVGPYNFTQGVDLFFDNLYVDNVVPTPGAGLLVGLAMAGLTARRRRSQA